MGRPVHPQKTLSKEISTSGVGLFTGESVSLTLIPAPPNTGIIFQRIDLPGKPEIPAHASFIREVPRSTRLGNGAATVHMVEHLLAALVGLGIDNLRIAVTGPEIPSGDGSALLFVKLIEQAGILEQDAPKKIIQVKEPIFWSAGDVHLVALPAEEFRLSYTLHYPQAEKIGTQYYSLTVTPERFKEEIAPCRTFALYEELLPFIEKGLLKGGGLENGLVFKGGQILNPEGARFPDEPARHKILDLIGDLALVGACLHAHVIAVRSGHPSHAAFAKILAKRENLLNG